MESCGSLVSNARPGHEAGRRTSGQGAGRQWHIAGPLCARSRDVAVALLHVPLGSGRPTATFVFRAGRIARGLSKARETRLLTSLDAGSAIRRALARSEDWAHAVTLAVRDRARALLREHPDLAASWEATPSTGDERYDVLLAALTAHEFESAGLTPPRWTQKRRLPRAWVLDTPRLSADEIRRQTPAWLADRNVFVARKDLEPL